MNPVPSVGQVLNLRWFVEPCQSSEQGVADAAEGGRYTQDLVHVLVDKLEALIDQVRDLEEGGGDEDGDDAGRFKSRLFCRVRMLCPTPSHESMIWDCDLRFLCKVCIVLLNSSWKAYINQSKILTSQWTEMSTSSSCCPRVISLK